MMPLMLHMMLPDADIADTIFILRQSAKSHTFTKYARRHTKAVIVIHIDSAPPGVIVGASFFFAAFFFAFIDADFSDED